MARAMARGWGEPMLCSDSGSGRAQALVDELGGEALSNLEVARRADLVILCHKPYQLKPVAREIADSAKVVVSVLGGTSAADVQRSYPNAQVFAVMPNTPVEIRQGVVIYADVERRPHDPEQPDTRAVSPVDPEVEAQVLALLGRLGKVVTVPERLMSTATSVTGVGPAYQALLAEAQIDAAVRHGIAAPLAAELVVQTMAGTAELLRVRDFDTLAVRREVTSPGGSTARGLAALEAAGLRSAFQDAADAVTLRTPGRN